MVEIVAPKVYVRYHLLEFTPYPTIWQRGTDVKTIEELAESSEVQVSCDGYRWDWKCFILIMVRECLQLLGKTASELRDDLDKATQCRSVNKQTKKKLMDITPNINKVRRSTVTTISKKRQRSSRQASYYIQIQQPSTKNSVSIDLLETDGNRFDISKLPAQKWSNGSKMSKNHESQIQMQYGHEILYHPSPSLLHN
ncbi:Uncharacterized protein Fot_24328 [Forsythia ovata]|uniref:Uncharacterized protein n=1 Tax=Forsythia ovata TaxID=205694 RepID=A0ABD1U5Y0_9LAMI